MARKITTSGDYNLNQSFFVGESTYTATAASKLAAWVRFTPSAPTDLGPHSLPCAYDGTEDTSTSTVGRVSRNIATFSDSGNQNARITPTVGELSMTSGTNEAIGAGTDSTDLPFSVSLWVKKASGPVSGAQHLFGKTGGKWGVYYYANTYYFRLLGNGSSDSETLAHDTTTYPVSTGEWYHLVFTYDGRGGVNANKGMNVYINGRLANGAGTSGSGAYDGGDYDPNGVLFIGGAYGAGSSEFSGDMAEFAVWKNHELSLEEVRAIYAGSSTSIASLISYISGVSSVPTRLQLRERDQRSGQYPINLSDGYDSLKFRKMIPFDDTNTITFLSNYATAKIHFDGDFAPGEVIDLTGSMGNVKKRFKFIVTSGSPSTVVDADDIVIPLIYPPEPEPPTPGAFRRRAAKKLVDAIRLQPDLDIDAKYTTKTIDRFDINGNPLEKRIVRQTLLLKHKKPNTGSNAQGNILSSKKYEPSFSSYVKSQFTSVEQFKIGTRNPISMGTLASLDGSSSTLISRGHSSPTIVTSGSLVPGITDKNYVPLDNIVLSPFDDSRIPLLTDSSFDSVGTDNKILENFQSPLSSKTMLKISCKSTNREGDRIFYASGAVGDSPLGTYTPENAGKTGSGFAYWNNSLKQWEMKASETSREEISPFASDIRNRSKSALGFTLNPSQSWDNSIQIPQNNHYQLLDTQRAFMGTSMPTNDYGFPSAAQYNATGSQEILMSNYINSPFLLEKIKVEIKGVFGVATSSLNQSWRTPINKTFFILNQRTDGDNPHVTGSLMLFNKEGRNPSGFTRVRVPANSLGYRGNREIVTWAKIGFLNENSYLFGSPSERHIEVASDFIKDYDILKKVPNEVISASPAYTSSLNFDLVPKLGLSNNVTMISSYKKADGAIAPLIQGNIEGGANLEGEASGRQIASSLGGSKIVGTGSFVFNQTTRLVEKESFYKTSPYLIFPEDRLILGWQNIMTLGEDGAAFPEYTSQAQGDLLSDKIQDVNVTLFGSLIRSDKEFHDTLSQNLTTDQVHEGIFGEKVLDQFEVEPISVLSGSTSDALFFGQMKEGTTGVRGRRASIAKGEAGSTGSLQRNIGFESGGQYQDSLAPHLEYFLSDPTFFGSSEAATSGLDEPLTIGSTFYRSIVLSNNPVSSSYGLLRTLGIHQRRQPRTRINFTKAVRISPASNYLVTPGAGPVTKAKFLAFDTSTSGGTPNYRIYSGSSNFVRGVTSFGSPEIATLRSKEPTRLLGSREEKIIISSIFLSAPTISMFGSITWPIIGHSSFGLLPLVRGAKYGFINPKPLSPKNYFRRSRYGQFRDMMEQAPETAVAGLIDIDKNKKDLEAQDGPVRVRFFARNGTPDVDPLDTNSQNLSQFATSSLPYFDGLFKERDIVTSPMPDDTDKTTIEEAVATIIDGDA